MSGKRVIICGGGIIGCSIAYNLTLKGLKPTIFERYEIAGCASGKSGGFLAFNWCDGSNLRNLARTSYQLHAELAKTLEEDCGYRTVHTLSLEAADLSRRSDNMRPEVEWLDTKLPTFNATEIGTPSTTAQVHPKKLTLALLAAAVRNGAEWKKGCVEGVIIEEGKVHGVLVDGEKVFADVVVLAMGPWTLSACSKWGLLPINAPKRECLAHSIVMHPKQPTTPHALFVEYVDINGKRYSPEVYPRPGGEVYMCGMARDVPLPEDPSQVAPLEGRCDKLKQVGDLLSSALKECPVTTQQACFLPSSPDGSPIIGKLSLDNAYIACGHTCWGILNAPATGLAMAELIVEGKSSIDLSDFDPKRLH